MAGSTGNQLIGKIALDIVDISKISIGNILIYSAGNTVTYHVDTNVVYQEEVDAEETILSPKTFTPTKDGWEFIGWRQDTTASGDVLDDLVMGDDPIVLYAVFQQSVTLSYNANGGSGTITGETKQRYYNNNTVSNPTFTLSANRFTAPTGYSFSRWALGSTGGAQYTAGSSVTLSTNATFFAIWIQSNLTVFSKSGANVAPTINNSSYVTLSGQFTNTAYGVGACYGAIWYGDPTTNTVTGTVTIKPGLYTKATIKLKVYVNNVSANGMNYSYGSASISGSFGSASRGIKGYDSSISDFTATATGNTLTLSASASVTKTVSGSWAEFGWYIESIVLS